MKRSHVPLLLAFLALPWPFALADTVVAKPAASQKAPASIVYRPPLRGAPAARVAGGTRGLLDALPGIEVLAPDHCGLTLSEQPTLFWYLSKSVNTPIEITLIEERVSEPLLELKLARAEAGLHALRLAEQGLRLKPGVQYQWLVALLVDPRQRSKDILSSALIRRVEPDAGLSSRMLRGNPDERLHVLAEAGIWYDLVDTLSTRIAEQPQDTQLRELRVRLLYEVGLREAAAYDRTAQ